MNEKIVFDPRTRKKPYPFGAFELKCSTVPTGSDASGPMTRQPRYSPDVGIGSGVMLATMPAISAMSLGDALVPMRATSVSGRSMCWNDRDSAVATFPWPSKIGRALLQSSGKDDSVSAEGPNGPLRLVNSSTMRSVASWVQSGACPGNGVSFRGAIGGRLVPWLPITRSLTVRRLFSPLWSSALQPRGNRTSKPAFVEWYV